MKEGMEGMRDEMNSVHQMLQTVLERGVPPFRRYAKQDAALPSYGEALQLELPVSLFISGPETRLNHFILDIEIQVANKMLERTHSANSVSAPRDSNRRTLMCICALGRAPT